MQTLLQALFVWLPIACALCLLTLVFGIRFLMGLATREKVAKRGLSSPITRFVYKTKPVNTFDCGVIPRATTPETDKTPQIRQPSSRCQSGHFSCGITGTC